MTQPTPTEHDIREAEKIALPFRRKDLKGGPDYFYGRDGFIPAIAKAISEARQEGRVEGAEKIVKSVEREAVIFEMGQDESNEGTARERRGHRRSVEVARSTFAGIKGEDKKSGSAEWSVTVSLCPDCRCATHTVEGECGKCGCAK